ncbi:formylglycine-generating enzyme family protein [Hyphococcus sp.]|uniref:formylglycine-generating enzyme family protein n=1 Tax=Hyphococcus sp. TaxID=2038636 RepID=UPI003CCBA010
MSAVSILHAPRDEALSEKIAAALARAGHAATRISADPSVGDLRGDALSDEGAAIVVWTEAAAKLARLHEQARQAMARGALIPVAVGGARPPGDFDALPPVDLSGWSGALDDPRWRFVLDEIKISQERAQLEDAPVWRPQNDEPSIESEAPAAPPSDAVAPVEPPPVDESYAGDLDVSDDEGSETDIGDALYAERLAPPSRPRQSRRRFKARDVAIGATAGLVGMTLATAAFAPFVLPDLGGGDAQQTASRPGAEQTESTTDPAIPDPSVDEPSRLATMRPLERVSPPVENGAGAQQDSVESAQNAVPENEGMQAPASSLDGMSDAAAPDISAPDAAGSLQTADQADTGVAPGAGEETGAPFDVADAETLPTESIFSPAEPSIKPQQTPPAEFREGAAEDAAEAGAADSDAMGNLFASIAAEDAGETNPNASVDPLPEELKETAYLGNYFKECIACPDMAALPGGSFRMGAPAGEAAAETFEAPTRIVTIEHRFAIGTREVTYDQWDACVAEGGCRAYAAPDHGWGRGNRPVVSVSHADAQAYTAWLSNKTGRNYRLPTEAEWEFAARGGSLTPFAYGERITSQRANFNGNYPYLNTKSDYRGQTTPVASFQPNPFGLFDMHGNAWEWTSDCWSASHAGAPSTGAARVSGDCSRRVLKGGAWNTGAWRLRSAHRIGKPVNIREFDNGFRVARDLD